MDRLLAALRGSDASIASRAAAEWGAHGVPSTEELIALLAMAPAIRSNFTTAFVVKTRTEEITWNGYEHVLWALGEAFRQILKRSRSKRRSVPLFDAVATLCEDRVYGKGRESFTMLLGQYGGPRSAPCLVRLLQDPVVDGHALYGLRVLGASGGREKAQRLLVAGSGWKRAEARKYLRKLYPDQVAT